jgi:hypothetical protein
MAYAALFELDLVAIEVDAGVSAKTLQRPILQPVLTRLKPGEARALLSPAGSRGDMRPCHCHDALPLKTMGSSAPSTFTGHRR